MSDEANPFSFDRNSLLRVVKTVIFVVLLWLVCLTVLLASTGQAAAIIPGFFSVWLTIILIGSFTPWEPYYDEPADRLVLLKKWDSISIFGVVVFGVVIPWLILTLRSYNILGVLCAGYLTISFIIVSLIFPGRTAELIIRGSRKQGRLGKDTIAILLKRNVALTVIISLPASWVAFDLGLYFLALFEVPIFSYLQAIGLILFLSSSPFFLFLLIFVELPGMISTASNKRIRRTNAENQIANLTIRNRLTAKEKIDLQTAYNELVRIELESDHPFPLLSKILGGGLLALIITIMVSLFV